jgi:ribosomal-protein-alanine N-acetyltransferase
MDNADIQIRDATQADRQRLANLIHFEVYVHRHLDWRSALDWIDSPPFLLACKGNRILGALACPPDPPNIGWLRLFAVADGMLPETVWELLWGEVSNRIKKMKLQHVYALALQAWFAVLLKHQSCEHVQDVIVLAWEGQYSTRVPSDHKISIRPMKIEDLEQVSEVDKLAFELEWRNSVEMLEMALRESSIATVAVNRNVVIGYQISTTSSMGGHLARLAVRPANQGQGVGTALVQGMLERFRARGLNRVTVNTQTDNHASLAIYRKSGFQQTIEIYPVFRLV